MVRPKKSAAILSVVLCLLAAPFNGDAAGTPSKTNEVDFDPGEQISRFVNWMQTNEIASFNGVDVSKITGWLDAQFQTAQQIEGLEKQIKADELLLAQKKQMLSDVQQRIKRLGLTPSQFEAVANYNKTILQTETSFPEWLEDHKMWFDTIKDTLIAIGFFVLGIYWDRMQEKRKKRKARRTNTKSV